jgi:hypothetical protein
MAGMGGRWREEGRRKGGVGESGNLEESTVLRRVRSLDEGRESRGGCRAYRSMKSRGEWEVRAGSLEESEKSREGGESRRDWRTYRSRRSRGGCGV